MSKPADPAPEVVREYEHDEGEESDEYDLDEEKDEETGGFEDDVEDEGDEEGEEEGQRGSSLTALLLGGNGEQDDDEEDEEEDEYQEAPEKVAVGEKRAREAELEEEDGEAKKVKV
ncbi:unnamed protein product [Peniophora sp. CBMAI 1063]|nr:unnamed protein product [Peniophora sp. CBMAI 1063]